MEDNREPVLTRLQIGRRLIIGAVVAILYGLVLYLLVWAGDSDSAGIRFLTGLFLLPAGVASLVSGIAAPRGRASGWRHITYGWAVILVLIFLSFAFFREGGICIVMAAPMMVIGSTAGSAATLLILRWISRPKSATTLVVALPLFAFPLEPYLHYETRDSQVRTVIEIAAPPETVWRQTVEIPEIDPAELPRTFSHSIVGTPKPQDAAMDGEGVGAVRNLRWDQGVRFQEIVTGWKQDRYLAWDFHFGPDAIPDRVEAHIDVDSDYLKLAGGDYVLEPLPDGGTRLTLTTRYRIATPINAYCEMWGRVFLGDFHRAVLTVIRDRSEAEAVARTPAKL